MEAKWVVYGKKADFNGIATKFNIDPVIARIIRNRDVILEEDIRDYLYGTLDMACDGSIMRDMDKGTEIIADSIRKGEKILIVSDYDVDGVMSNYILLDGLKKLSADVIYRIPDRVEDGYGINEKIIREGYEKGVKTIITCDNGIAAFPAIELAKELSMRVVVTDHHQVPYETDEAGNRQFKLVPADAVIDIAREDCEYPNKSLCGAGVAYKFIKCLYNVLGVPWKDELAYMEMLALATLCDVMDLQGENRVFVKEGLKCMSHTKNIGLKALIKANALEGKPLSSYHLGFVLGPCINATGRLEKADLSLELLMAEDEKKAVDMAEELLALNVSRKNMTEEGVKEAISYVESCENRDTVLVIYMPKLHESIAGIVAGRVKEHFYQPVLVLTDSEEGMVKGSGRSIEGYHMFDELTKVKDILVKYGGHELAAGFSLRKKELEEFRKRLNENHSLTEDELTPVVRLDVAMPVDYISVELVNQLKLLEPFGKGNQKPVFGQSNLGIKRATFIGKNNQFIRIVFQDSEGFIIEGVDFDANRFINCIKVWFSEEECDKMLKGMPNSIRIDVAYYPSINDYGGRHRIQIQPVMYRKSQ